MNKDLEIIKKTIRADYNDGEKWAVAIVEAAERMAAEIEAQSKVNYAAHELLKDKNRENARLKAELAGRPKEIVCILE